MVVLYSLTSFSIPPDFLYLECRLIHCRIFFFCMTCSKLSRTAEWIKLKGVFRNVSKKGIQKVMIERGLKKSDQQVRSYKCNELSEQERGHCLVESILLARLEWKPECRQWMMSGVSVSSTAVTKAHKLLICGIYNRNYCFTVPELRSPRSRCWQGLPAPLKGTRKGLFLTPWQQNFRLHMTVPCWYVCLFT